MDTNILLYGGIIVIIALFLFTPGIFSTIGGILKGAGDVTESAASLATDIIDVPADALSWTRRQGASAGRFIKRQGQTVKRVGTRVGRFAGRQYRRTKRVLSRINPF